MKKKTTNVNRTIEDQMLILEARRKLPHLGDDIAIMRRGLWVLCELLKHYPSIYDLIVKELPEEE